MEYVLRYSFAVITSTHAIDVTLLVIIRTVNFRRTLEGLPISNIEELLDLYRTVTSRFLVRILSVIQRTIFIVVIVE